MPTLRKTLEQAWYKSSRIVWLLLPLSWLFCLISITRRRLYQTGIKKSFKAKVPVVVVGNIVVGGSGKTPLLITLCEYLKTKGHKPGVVSRGYGGSFEGIKQLAENDAAALVGDEPAMIVRRTGVPVVIGSDRVAAVDHLLANNDCDIVLSDDGLQHYRMQRALEIAVIDAERGLGNGFCLPAGPLRERASRLQEVDIVVYNASSNAYSVVTDSSGVGQGGAGRASYRTSTVSSDRLCSYQLEVVEFSRLNGNEKFSLEKFVERYSEKNIHAVAGIGNPDRFFAQMRSSGLRLIEHGFSDHHQYQQQDFSDWKHDIIIMTEKDAVKCRQLDLADAWQVTVQARLSATLDKQLTKLLIPLLGNQPQADR